MSLEQVIHENTVAINKLTAALLGSAQSTLATGQVQEAKEKTDAVVNKAKTETKKSGAPTAPTSPTVTEEAEVAQEKTVSHSGVSYAQVRKVVLKKAATHREGIKAVNAKHGITRLSALLKDENDFESVIDQAALEAVYADLQALED